MNEATNLSEQIQGVFFGGNWTDSNFKDQLADVTVEEAFTQIDGLNTIARLAYHISYFVNVQLRVLEGGPLEGRDAESFDVPEFRTEEEWRSFLDAALRNARRHADLVAELDDKVLATPFVNAKYGSWWENLIGLIEHSHYHLGQIALLKRLIRSRFV
jgi:uncharacterized damage-inducible protein DinB